MEHFKIAIINDTPIQVRPEGKSYTDGGTASFVGSLLPLFEKRGFNIHLIGNFSIGSDSHAVVSRIDKKSNLAFTFALFWHFLTHKINKDFIYYFHRPDHLFVSFFLSRIRLLHLHGNSRETMLKSRPWYICQPYLIFEYCALRIANKVVVTDKITKNYYIKHYPFLKDKIHLLPSGFDSIYFFPKDKSKIKKEKGLSELKKYLIYVGRLAYPKQINEMIAGFHEMLKTRNDVEFLIVGDGKERLSLEKLVHKLDLENKVHFLGSLPKQDVCDYINCADGGILISLTEGSPVSVKECLACGIPVLTNHVGDVEDYVIHGQTGFIVDHINPPDIASAMKILIDNAPKMKDQCIEVASHYSSAYLFEQLLNIIDDHIKDKID